jgi:hypothetical protein
MTDSEWRVEKDSLGEVKVPAKALYGAQTQRAVLNFPISGLRPWRAFIWSMAVIKQAAAEVNRVNADEDVRWLYSFLSADKRKTYCLYEADSPDAIIAAARRAGLPADVVVELGSRITSEGRLIPVDR